MADAGVWWWQVMVISHSWGDNVFRNFMVWASSDDTDWVDRHIAVYANIAGPTLGVPKSLSSFLSGEPPAVLRSLCIKNFSADAMKAQGLALCQPRSARSPVAKGRFCAVDRHQMRSIRAACVPARQHSCICCQQAMISHTCR